MRMMIIGIILVLGAVELLGCETMKGAGRDIQGGGRSVERAATNAQ